MSWEAAAIGAGALGNFLTPGQTTMMQGNLQPFSGTTGLGSVGYGGGQFNTQLSQPQANMQNQLMGAASGMFDQLGSYDPLNYTRDQYGMLQELLRPQQEKAVSDMESRLFAQGRLGSTGGALQQQAVQDAINQQNLQAAMQAQQSGLQAQQALSQMGRGLFETALTPEQMLMNQMQVMGGLAPRDILREGGETPLDNLTDAVKGGINSLREGLGGGAIGDVGTAALLGGGVAATGALGATAQTGALLGGAALPYVGAAVLANEFAKRNSAGMQRLANKNNISGIGSLKSNGLWKL